MEDILIMTDKTGGPAVLTTDSPKLWGGPRPGSGRPTTGRKKKTFYVTGEEALKLTEYLKGMRENE